MKRSLLSLVLFAFALPAVAAEDTANINVSASVAGTCTFDADSANLAFGAYSGSALPGTADLAITCTGSETGVLTLDNGDYFDSSRQMANGTARLAYGLYTDATHETAWPALGVDVLVTGTTTVYGLIAAGTVPAAGSYTDTVVATITY